MSFKNLAIKDTYITEKNDIPNEFYNVVLPESVLYKRAAGFFSSSALISISKGLQQFYYNGGTIQLIVSPIFSKEDYEAIEKGYQARADKITEALIKNFNIEDIKNDDGCNFLAWLIYENRLEIKIVTRKDNNYGIFHDKFLILYDEEGNKISSRGSSNESRTAFEDNYETIEVDFSWDTSRYNRTKQRETQFDEIWYGNNSQWITSDFPEAIKRQLIQIRKPIEHSVNSYISKDTQENEFVSNIDNNTTISIPSFIKLREYQNNAIREWTIHQFKGIYEMATGTGKTITAISSIVKLIEQFEKANYPCGLVFVVPYKVLLEQWVDNLALFNIQPICCYDSKKTWLNRAKNAIDLFNNGYTNHFCLITTNKTFIDSDFQTCLQDIKKDYIFCADEMHHLATDKALNYLPQNARFRLGLSATLMTKYADKEMDDLKSYFGGIIYEFPMEKAIGKFLTPYYYHPVFVDLTPDELDEYHEISKKISKICAVNGTEKMLENPSLTALLAQRARLIASASNKIEKLKEFKDKLVGTKFNLFYCGDKVETETNEKFIEKVNEVLKNDIGISAQKFTSEESKKQRENILKLFSNGIIQGLTAIRCLDEGVDIPALQRAFILSSGTNPKEFIQRRGRVLRKAKNKEFAEIYDFIVLPTLDPNRIGFLSIDEINIEKKIIAREYERLQEFAKLAINGTEAFDEFLSKWEMYSNGGNI